MLGNFQLGNSSISFFSMEKLLKLLPKKDAN